MARSADGQASGDLLDISLPTRSTAPRFIVGVTLTFPPHILRLLILFQRGEPGTPQMVVGHTLSELELPDQHRLDPQCRMPDYAESTVTTVVISAFSVISVRHN